MPVVAEARRKAVASRRTLELVSRMNKLAPWISTDVGVTVPAAATAALSATD